MYCCGARLIEAWKSGLGTGARSQQPRPLLNQPDRRSDPSVRTALGFKGEFSRGGWPVRFLNQSRPGRVRSKRGAHAWCKFLWAHAVHAARESAIDVVARRQTFGKPGHGRERMLVIDQIGEIPRGGPDSRKRLGRPGLRVGVAVAGLIWS